MFDAVSYVMGVTKNAAGKIVITSDMTFEDDGEGNITIEESE